MFCTHSDQPIPLFSFDRTGLDAWLETAAEPSRRWVEASAFRAAAGSYLPIPNGDGTLAAVLAGRDSGDRLWALAHLPALLPAGDYRFESDWSPAELERAAIGWGLGA